MPQLSFHSAIGDLTVSEDNGVIVSVDWGWGQDQETTPLLENARDQIQDYLDGKRTGFDLPLAPPGTDFQKRVWAAMRTIPFGQVQTYGDMAKQLNSAARAVGMACGANPIPVVIPCHRVVARTGLGGYSGEGGLDTKRALLALEGYHVSNQPELL